MMHRIRTFLFCFLFSHRGQLEDKVRTQRSTGAVRSDMKLHRVVEEQHRVKWKAVHYRLQIKGHDNDLSCAMWLHLARRNQLDLDLLPKKDFATLSFWKFVWAPYKFGTVSCLSSHRYSTPLTRLHSTIVGSLSQVEEQRTKDEPTTPFLQDFTFVEGAQPEDLQR